jgi:hypothetical protein
MRSDIWTGQSAVRELISDRRLTQYGGSGGEWFAAECGVGRGRWLIADV